MIRCDIPSGVLCISTRPNSCYIYMYLFFYLSHYIGAWTGEPYFQKHQTKSVLCMPLIQKANLAGIVYLENNLFHKAFTQERFELLKVLSSQIAISVENALMLNDLRYYSIIVIVIIRIIIILNIDRYVLLVIVMDIVVVVCCY